MAMSGLMGIIRKKNPSVKIKWIRPSYLEAYLSIIAAMEKYAGLKKDMEGSKQVQVGP